MSFVIVVVPAAVVTVFVVSTGTFAVVLSQLLESQLLCWDAAAVDVVTEAYGPFICFL